MKISSTSKIHNPLSRKYKRQRAGQKGIGRFSVQRLGTSLTIITQPENAEQALELKINWDDYANDLNLLSISNELEYIDKQKSKGTSLIISGLRDKWSKAAIQRVYRYVSNIMQPFSLSDIDDSLQEDGIIDLGFQATFYKLNDDGKAVSVADKSAMIYEHAVAEIEGIIDENGLGIYTVDSKKLQINEIGDIGNDPDDNTKPFTELKNVRFKAYYYIFDSDLIPKLHQSSLRKMARREGGIRLYRNGFRVLPYGEPGDDWLSLDRSVRRRTILPQHGNVNFFGFVEIKDKQNKYNETSSREGLIDSQAVVQLKNFVYRTLMTGVIKVANSRNIKIVSGQSKRNNDSWDEVDLRIKNIALTIEELDKEFDNEQEGTEVKKKRKKKVKRIIEAVEEIQEIQQAAIKKTIKERSMLRVLSSVGLTVAQFVHEIKHYMDNIKTDVSFLIEELQGQQKALDTLATLKGNFDSFYDYTSYFNDVVSQNIIKDVKPQNMRFVINSFIKSMSSDANNVGIKFNKPHFGSDWLYTKAMHPSEWSSILFNFYTNSKKAIRRAQSQGEIMIECGEENGSVYLEFSDNGDGIKKENEELVFDEFYTTTSVETLGELNQNTEILGTGLGLKITRDIVKSYRGNIFVTSPKSYFSTCIRVEISKVSDKEQDIYGI